jgi:hypothetical protein
MRVANMLRSEFSLLSINTNRQEKLEFFFLSIHVHLIIVRRHNRIQVIFNMEGGNACTQDMKIGGQNR